jgi:hypothetical protein
MEDPREELRKIIPPNKHYREFTAAMKMKDTELERIVQLDKKFNTKVDALTHHYELMKKQRAKLSIIHVNIRSGTIHCQPEEETT